MIFSYTIKPSAIDWGDMKKKKSNKKEEHSSLGIFPDSSWLISLLCENDGNHQHVKSSFGFLSPRQPTFFLSSLVVLEAMNGLTKKENGHTVKTAEQTLFKFLKKVNYMTEKPIKLEKILHKYHQFAKMRKIRTNTSVDFYIITEAMTVGAKILTADKKMYQLTKPTYKDIYLISEKVKGVKSDLPRLVANVVHNLKT